MYSNPEPVMRRREVYSGWPVPVAMAAFPWPMSSAPTLRDSTAMPAIRVPRTLSFLEERDDKYDSRASRWHRTRLSWVRRSERATATARMRNNSNNARVNEADEEAGRMLEVGQFLLFKIYKELLFFFIEHQGSYSRN